MDFVVFLIKMCKAEMAENEAGTLRRRYELEPQFGCILLSLFFFFFLSSARSWWRRGLAFVH